MKINLTLLDRLSLPGSDAAPNEDLIILADGLAVVLDGATGLGDATMRGEPSDAAWFVRSVADYLVPAWEEHKDFRSALTSALVPVTNLFQARTRWRAVPKYEVPSSGLIAVAIEQDRVTVYRMGDCAALYRNGRIAPLFAPPKLEVLDEQAIMQLRLLMGAGLTQQEARAITMPKLRRNRELMNTAQGYPALTIGTECLACLESVPLSPSPGDRMLLCSDGFSTAYEKFKTCTMGDLLSDKRAPLSALVAGLRQAESADASLLKFPRLKPHDDATAIAIEFAITP